MMKQRTIASPVKTVGIGLHSGRKVTIVIKPAPINSGVQFVRVDTEQQSVVPATATAVCDTRLADRKSTRLNSSHIPLSRMPSSA